MLQLDLEHMTVEEKLAAIGLIWESIDESCADFSLPEWQEQELSRRKRDLQEGKETPEEWEAVKSRLRKMFA